jgi:hypothetical protein
MFIDESFPLWCVTSLDNGGLSWDTKEVGLILASVGLGMVLYQIFCFESCMKRFFSDSRPVDIVSTLITICSGNYFFFFELLGLV